MREYGFTVENVCKRAEALLPEGSMSLIKTNSSLQCEVKRRGPVVDLAAVKMDFRYDDWFPKERAWRPVNAPSGRKP